MTKHVEEVASAAPMQRLERDGVALAFTEAGEGDPALVFVHGWGCDHRFFAPQLREFSADLRVLAVDLRGHGQSDVPPGPYHPDTFAEDLAWLLSRRGLDRPVVVGHSMGGVIALRFAHLYPDRLSALIALDSGWAMRPEFLRLAPEVSQGLAGADYQVVLRSLMDGLFAPSDDPVRKERILETMAATDHDVLLSSWAEGIEQTDTDVALATLAVPTLYIASDTSVVDLERIRANPNVTVGQTVGCGHFHQLECSDQVNAMIERFLATKVDDISSRPERSVVEPRASTNAAPDFMRPP